MKPEARLESVIRREIVECLREKQHMNAAADLLGLGRQTLYNRVKALKIESHEWRGVSPLAVSGPPASDGCASPDLLKELADLVARYARPSAVPPDPIVLGEFYVPANGFPRPIGASGAGVPPASFNGSSRRKEGVDIITICSICLILSLILGGQAQLMEYVFPDVPPRPPL